MAGKASKPSCRATMRSSIPVMSGHAPLLLSDATLTLRDGKHRVQNTLGRIIEDFGNALVILCDHAQYCDRAARNRVACFSAGSIFPSPYFISDCLSQF